MSQRSDLVLMPLLSSLLLICGHVDIQICRACVSVGVQDFMQAALWGSLGVHARVFVLSGTRMCRLWPCGDFGSCIADVSHVHGS